MGRSLILLQIRTSHPQQPASGVQTRTSSGEAWVFVHSKVYKGACQLDETLVKISLVGGAIAQPQVLQNVMRLVKVTGIKALQPAQQMSGLGAAMQMGNALCNSGALVAHGVNLL